MSLQTFIQLFLQNLASASVLMLATMGIILIFKTSYTTNFAQGMIAAFAAYVTATMAPFIVRLFPGLPTIVQLGIGMLFGIIMGFAIGLFVDIFIIRKSKLITSNGKQMITMGLVLVLSGLIPVIFGVLPQAIQRLDTTTRTFDFLGMTFTMPMHGIYTIVIAFTVLLVVAVMLRYTKWGLGVRATASNEVVASMMGVNTRFITAMSWAIAGGLGALAATLHAPNDGMLTSAIMNSIQVNGFLASILGGFSSFFGPIVGAFLIPIVNGYIAYFESTWRGVIVYVLILIVILIKPVGLFGKKIAKKV